MGSFSGFDIDILRCVRLVKKNPPFPAIIPGDTGQFLSAGTLSADAAARPGVL